MSSGLAVFTTITIVIIIIIIISVIVILIVVVIALFVNIVIITISSHQCYYCPRRSHIINDSKFESLGHWVVGGDLKYFADPHVYSIPCNTKGVVYLKTGSCCEYFDPKVMKIWSGENYIITNSIVCNFQLQGY